MAEPMVQEHRSSNLDLEVLLIVCGLRFASLCLFVLFLTPCSNTTQVVGSTLDLSRYSTSDNLCDPYCRVRIFVVANWFSRSGVSVFLCFSTSLSLSLSLCRRCMFCCCLEASVPCARVHIPCYASRIFCVLIKAISLYVRSLSAQELPIGIQSWSDLYAYQEM